MSNEVNTTPLGEPMWEGEVTYSMAEMICSGLERIKPENIESVMKRFAFEWMAARQETATLRAERDALLEAITYEGAEVVNRVTAKVLAARAAGKGNDAGR